MLCGRGPLLAKRRQRRPQDVENPATAVRVTDQQPQKGAHGVTLNVTAISSMMDGVTFKLATQDAQSFRWERNGGKRDPESILQKFANSKGGYMRFIINIRND